MTELQNRMPAWLPRLRDQLSEFLHPPLLRGANGVMTRAAPAGMAQGMTSGIPAGGAARPTANNEALRSFAPVDFRGETSDVRLLLEPGAETFWATRAQIALLFAIAEDVLDAQINLILREGMLNGALVSRTLPVPEMASEALFYNFDLMLAVGYRVNCSVATRFRQWACCTILAHLVDGFALQESRMVADPVAKRRIAGEVRALRRGPGPIYQAVRRCFRLAATDYDPLSPELERFEVRLQDAFLAACSGAPSVEMAGDGGMLSDAVYDVHMACERFLFQVETASIHGQSFTMAELGEHFGELVAPRAMPSFRGHTAWLYQRAREHAELELSRISLALSHIPRATAALRQSA
jgi:hypothetical protein